MAKPTCDRCGAGGRMVWNRDETRKVCGDCADYAISVLLDARPANEDGVQDLMDLRHLAASMERVRMLEMPIVEPVAPAPVIVEPVVSLTLPAPPTTEVWMPPRPINPNPPTGYEAKVSCSPAPEKAEAPVAKPTAKEFLLHALANGERLLSVIVTEAEAAGITRTAINQAKIAHPGLFVSRREGRQAWWRLADQTDATAEAKAAVSPPKSLIAVVESAVANVQANGRELTPAGYNAAKAEFDVDDGFIAWSVCEEIGVAALKLFSECRADLGPAPKRLLARALREMRENGEAGLAESKALYRLHLDGKRANMRGDHA